MERHCYLYGGVGHLIEKPVGFLLKDLLCGTTGPPPTPAWLSAYWSVDGLFMYV